jgi:hypothetical protein
MAIWGGGQKLCGLLQEDVATWPAICDKTLMRRQNRVAKLESTVYLSSSKGIYNLVFAAQGTHL